MHVSAFAVFAGSYLAAQGIFFIYMALTIVCDIEYFRHFDVEGEIFQPRRHLLIDPEDEERLQRLRELAEEDDQSESDDGYSDGEDDEHDHLNSDDDSDETIS